MPRQTLGSAGRTLRALALAGWRIAAATAMTGNGTMPALVRVGDYRIICTVVDDVLLLVVVTLRHRGDGYDR